MATVIRFRKARFLPQEYSGKYLLKSYSAKTTNVYFTTSVGIPYAIPHFIP